METSRRLDISRLPSAFSRLLIRRSPYNNPIDQQEHAAGEQQVNRARCFSSERYEAPDDQHENCDDDVAIHGIPDVGKKANCVRRYTMRKIVV